MNILEKSEVIRDGMRKSFRDVDSKVGNRICYGYSKLENGELIVN